MASIVKQDFLATVGEVSVFELEHDGEDYLVVCDEAPTCFVYTAFDVQMWLEGYEAVECETTLERYSRAYQDFCETCDPVEDEAVALAVRAELRHEVMRAGSCIPVLPRD